MQIFCFVLLPVILAVAHAGDNQPDPNVSIGDTTILEMLFKIPDANANGAWEMQELTRYVKGALRNSLFEVVDTNVDKRVTIGEFKEICLELLQVIFKLNDHNGDGFITSLEMLSGDTAIEPNIEIFAILFKGLDVNHDGFLSSEDAFTEKSNEDPLNFTGVMDVNKDGVIGMQEYNQKHDLLGLPKAPTELVKLYNITDKNMDDKFTLEEIQDVLRTSFAIMDEDSDGIATLEEQLHALTQVGLSKAQADDMRVKWQMSRSVSFDMVNKIIAIIDTDNDEQVSQDELNGILESPYNPLKIMELVKLSHDASSSYENDGFQLEPEQQLSTKQAMESLGRFLDNPRFTRAAAAGNQNKVATSTPLVAAALATWLLGRQMF